MALRRKIHAEGTGGWVDIDDTGTAIPRESTATVTWSGDVDLDLVVRARVLDGQVRIVSAEFRSEHGLDLERMQRQFKWRWLTSYVDGLAVGPKGVDAPLVARRVSRKPSSDEVAKRHAEVAAIYREYPHRDVVRHVAAEMERRHPEKPVPHGTARRWITEARAAGVLESTTPGKRSPAAAQKRAKR